MAALNDVDELIKAHTALIGGGVGAPPVANGARVGASLLRAGTTLISAALQTEVEEVFKHAIERSFTYFTPEEREKYWTDCKGWGNPSPQNIRRLFFRIGFADVLSGLSWQKCNAENVIRILDGINQIRNRVVHGQPLSIDGHRIALTKPLVTRWRNFGGLFIGKFRNHVDQQYD